MRHTPVVYYQVTFSRKALEANESARARIGWGIPRKTRLEEVRDGVVWGRAKGRVDVQKLRKTLHSQPLPSLMMAPDLVAD